MAQIDLTTLTRFGNMLGGYGLSAMTDNNSNTNCYCQATSGYAGIVLAEPTTIGEAQIDSQVNGFDASGLSSTITLRLYGKTNGTPSSSTDGNLLGTLTFADTESLQTKSIIPNDTTTEFNAVWWKIDTGVWAASTGMRLYSSDENLPIKENIPLIESRTIMAKSVNSTIPLSWNMSELDDFSIKFETSASCLIQSSFYSSFVHRGEYTGYNGAVGVGIRMCYKYSTSASGLSSAVIVYPLNSVGGFNISERNPDHYGVMTLIDAHYLPAGFYEFLIFGSSHSTGSNSDGLAAILSEGTPSHGLNRYIIEIDPSANFIEIS